MSLETNAERRRKRITEHWISGFPTAKIALNFSDAVRDMISNKTKVKYRSCIEGANTILAIDENWNNPTILKITCLEMDQDQAIFVSQGMKKTIKLNGFKLEKEIIREKPQPQRLGM